MKSHPRLKRENPRLDRGQVKVSCGLGGDEPASDIIDVINDFDGGVLAGYAGVGRNHFCEAAIRRNLLFNPNTDLLEDLAPGDPLARQELRVSADDDPTVWAAMPAKRSLTNCSLEIATTLPFDNRHHFRCCTASHPDTMEARHVKPVDCFCYSWEIRCERARLRARYCQSLDLPGASKID